MWPFKKKWESKDPKTRLQGLAELNSKIPSQKEKLERIAKDDEIYKVRQLAFKLLGEERSQEAIMDCAFNDKNDSFRSGAVGHLNDQKALIRILRDDKSPGVQESAISKLRHVDEFEDSDLKIYKAAIAKLKDQSLLAHIATEAFNEEVALAALYALSDQSFLFDIVTTTIYPNVSQNAFEKLTDQNILYEIAIKNYDPGFFDYDGNIKRIQKVLEKIDDQKLLADIAIQSPNELNLSETVEKITDQNLLFKVIKETKYSTSYDEAIERLTDQNLLIEVVKNYSDRDIIFNTNVIRRITDQNFLIELAENHIKWDFRWNAVYGINDLNILKGIAKNDDQNINVRCLAIRKLKDQGTLAEIAKNDKDPNVRLAALEQITDSNIIVETMKNEINNFVLKGANKRLNFLKNQKE